MMTLIVSFPYKDKDDDMCVRSFSIDKRNKIDINLKIIENMLKVTHHVSGCTITTIVDNKVKSIKPVRAYELKKTIEECFAE